MAKRAYASSFCFQRVFGLVCGLTLGGYIRRRRLALAGNDLLTNRAKGIDVALKYGYQTPESFSRAFQKFHGVMLSKVKRGQTLKSFSRLSVKADFTGGHETKYKIEEKSELTLVGYKKRFMGGGGAYGEERADQEEQFVTTTRAKQWLLLGASEVVAMHWRPCGAWEKERYIEIRLPVEKKGEKERRKGNSSAGESVSDYH